MCARLRLLYNQKKLEKLLGSVSILDQLISNPNTAPTEKAIIVASNAGEVKARQANFGLYRSWLDKQSSSAKFCNARLETVEEKPAFRGAFVKRHCLIPANGFYEWREENGRKQPYLFQRKDSELIMLAGLWEARMENDMPFYSFTILTTKPNDLMAEYHNRMPVIMRDENLHDWLENKADKSLLETMPSENLEAIQVSPKVNTPKTKDVEMIDRI